MHLLAVHSAGGCRVLAEALSLLHVLHNANDELAEVQGRGAGVGNSFVEKCFNRDFALLEDGAQRSFRHVTRMIRYGSELARSWTIPDFV